MLPTILLIVLSLSAAIQIFFYIGYLRVILYKNKAESNTTRPVSVIICAKNEAENLRNFLPSILEQDYPDFNVIVVNDASEDDTEIVLSSFAEKYKHLYFTNIPKSNKFRSGKKLALTIGIKASKKDFFIFTDSDCKAPSKNWLMSMQSNFSGTKEIVLGYGAYLRRPGFTNHFIRTDTALIALNYMSYSLMSIPYMGVGRNLGYTRDTYARNNGFVSHAHISSGDDDLFIQKAATKINTCITTSNESFTYSEPCSNFRQFIKQKRRHISTSYHYKIAHKILLFLEPLSKYALFASVGFLLYYQEYLIATAAIFSSRVLFRLAIYFGIRKKLNEKVNWLVYTLYDIVYPIIAFFISLSKNTRNNKTW